MNLKYETHHVTSSNPDDHPWYPAWLTAVQQGFHDPYPSQKFLEHQLKIDAERKATARTVLDDESRKYGLGKDIPVATFMDWTGELNVGGKVIDCHQISEVTVLASHRRQGIATTLMTESLTDAKEKGLAVAALTATEAAIYGRFGFGPAIFSTSVELHAGSGFSVSAPVTGSCEYIDVTQLAEASRHVFDKFHAYQTGSINRCAPEMEIRNGSIDKRSRETNDKTRAIGHWNEKGELDGYATWRLESRGGALDVIDFVPCNTNASIAMWSFLGSLDLVRRVRFDNARNDEHLPWALADRRRYQINEHNDFLWLRVIDPKALLEARNYYTEGDVTFRVVDPMGIADGTWRLTVKDGKGTCEPYEGEPQVEIDVPALGSTLLGGVNIQALETVGWVRGDEDAVDKLGILLQRRREPWCVTYF